MFYERKKIFYFIKNNIDYFSQLLFFVLIFVLLFGGVNYELNVDQTNIAVIEENLQKDDIKIEDLKDVRKIEIRGAGLNDYSVLFHFYIMMIIQLNLLIYI